MSHLTEEQIAALSDYGDYLRQWYDVAIKGQRRWGSGDVTHLIELIAVHRVDLARCRAELAKK